MSRSVTTKSAALALWLFAACCSANDDAILRERSGVDANP